MLSSVTTDTLSLILALERLSDDKDDKEPCKGQTLEQEESAKPLESSTQLIHINTAAPGYPQTSLSSHQCPAPVPQALGPLDRQNYRHS